MSQQDVKVVEHAIAAINERDTDRYLARCTEDIQLQPPWTAVEGVYEGPDAVRRFFVDLRDTIPDFQLAIERLESTRADQVLASVRAARQGEPAASPLAPLCPTAPSPPAGSPLRTSTTSSTARSDASGLSSTGKKPWKPSA